MTNSIKVLVTGGSGFLGNACIEALHQAHPDWTLYNLDIRPPKASAKAQYLQADVTSATEVHTAFQQANPDAIIHTAGLVPGGQARYSHNEKIRARVFNVNVDGTRHVLQAARQTACRAMVHTSSCTVISDDLDHDYPNMHEGIPTGNAKLIYGSSKARAEPIVLKADDETLSTCALRPATIIGPGDSFGVIATIATCIDKGEMPFIIGDGDNLYDFVYVSNVADAHILALENLLAHHPSSPLASLDSPGACSKYSAAGKALFVSNQEPVYFRDFMLAIWAHLGHAPRFQIRVPMSLAWVAGLLAEGWTWVTGAEQTLSRGSVRDAVGTRYSDNTRARAVLGYVPRVKFVDAVRLACEVRRIVAQRDC